MELEKLDLNFIPDSLSDSEKFVWKKIAPNLIKLEIINIFNYSMLERYCVISVQADILLRTKPNLSTAIKELQKELRALEKQLCLTPQAFNKFQTDKLLIEEKKKKLYKDSSQDKDSFKESFFE